MRGEDVCARMGGDRMVEGMSRKRSCDEKYGMATVGQLVFLLDENGGFINVWHKDNVERAKPGTLDVNKGTK